MGKQESSKYGQGISLLTFFLLRASISVMLIFVKFYCALFHVPINPLLLSSFRKFFVCDTLMLFDSVVPF